MLFTYHLHELSYLELFYLRFIFKRGGGEIAIDNMQCLFFKFKKGNFEQSRQIKYTHCFHFSSFVAGWQYAEGYIHKITASKQKNNKN